MRESRWGETGRGGRGDWKDWGVKGSGRDVGGEGGGGRWQGDIC